MKIRSGIDERIWSYTACLFIFAAAVCGMIGLENLHKQLVQQNQDHKKVEEMYQWYQKQTRH